MAWKGWQTEVLECIREYSRSTGKLHFSVDDIHSRCGAELEKRAPSRDHIDRTIRGSIRSACRQLAKKGRIVKVGAKGTNYQMPGPPPIERFDLPDDVEQQIKAWLDQLGQLPDDRHERLFFLCMVLFRASFSLQRRCTALEEKLKAVGAPPRETSDSAKTPAPLDASATLHGGLPTPAKAEPGQTRFPQLAKSVGALIRGLLEGS